MQDGAAAAVFGLIIGMLQLSFEKYCINKVIFNLICSLAVGVGICAAAKLFPVFNADKIIIGDIMLLIPGVAMTNAVRDILVGDTISGVMRLTETILWAASLACGFIVAILLIGI